MPLPGIEDGRRRAIIERMEPLIDGGRFPIKRTLGESVVVEADLFADGHDLLAGTIQYRREEEPDWRETPLAPLANDRWRGSFSVDRLGRYRFRIAAWVDHFLTWRHDLARRETPEDITVALVIGGALVEAAAQRAGNDDALKLRTWAARLRGDAPLALRRATGLNPELEALMRRYPDRRLENHSEQVGDVVVDRPLARFGAWYEFFPRSCSAPSGHGTLHDCEARLAYVAEMGFDIVYLPPIHPIGQTHRKGRNNSLTAETNDPGSPWAIGSAEGGHKSVHPLLGSLEEFRHFLAAAEARGLEVAIDIAFQCAPDHPYVGEHPEWFLHRPDGSVQYAENPPKKYEDIYPFHFEAEAWEPLWLELKSVIDFWIEQGVTIFRVDNPHTKPFPFWEWLINAVKSEHPEVLFLAEAFSRPKIMYRLAKLGFSQSYTYFTWRNTKWEIEHYMAELTRGRVREFFRPNFWPNTPDILPEYLQYGGRAAFMNRLVLAATLSASYGVYGPAFELLEGRAREPGSEEYLDSEKYQVRDWNLERPDSLREFITRVNRIRRENPALQHDWNLRFHPADNPELLCYSKWSDEPANLLLVVVNLDPHHTQSGWVDLPLDDLGIDSTHPFQAHDLLTGSRHLWHGSHNYVQVDPARSPAHIFRLRRRIRTEHDFEYFF